MRMMMANLCSLFRYGYWAVLLGFLGATLQAHSASADPCNRYFGLVRQDVLDAADNYLGKTKELAENEGTALFLDWLKENYGVKAPRADEEPIKNFDDLLARVEKTVTPRNPADPKWFSGDATKRTIGVPEGKNVLEVFLKKASEMPDQVAILDEMGGAHTYRDLVMKILIVRPFLAKLDAKVVGVMLPPGVGSAVMYLSLMSLGKIPFELNYAAGEPVLRPTMEKIGVTQVLTSSRLAKELEKGGRSIEWLKDQSFFVEDLKAQITKVDGIKAKVASYLNWNTLWKATPDEMAHGLTTSGSSSLPKGLYHSNKHMLRNIRAVVKGLDVKPDDVILGFLPNSHIMGLVGTMLTPILSGVRAVYQPNTLDLKASAEMIWKYQATITLAPGQLVESLYRISKPYQLQSLRKVVMGGEKILPSTLDLIERVTPRAEAWEGYGSTEAGIVTLCRAKRAGANLSHSLHSWGPILDGFTYKISSVENPTAWINLEQNPNAMGLLLLGGTDFRGYINEEGASPIVRIDGVDYYDTGDVVRVVEKNTGDVTPVDRARRMIKINGEMIPIQSMEDVLVGKFGAADLKGPMFSIQSLGDNQPFVLFTTRTDLDKKEINAWFSSAGLLSGAKISEIWVLEKLPTLAIKVDGAALKQMLKAREK